MSNREVAEALRGVDPFEAEPIEASWGGSGLLWAIAGGIGLLDLSGLEAAALHEIVARIDREASERGAEVLGSELVGLMPAGAAAAAAGAILRIDGFDESRVLELRLLP